ncbi:transposase [Enterobacter ludwigii]
MTYYAYDGCAEADINIAETALQMVSRDRKNWQFFGSYHGDERSPLLYMMIGSGRANRTA